MRAVFIVVATVIAALALTVSSQAGQATYRIDHVTDGDTVVLRNGQKVRLVQIDTPEVYSAPSATAPKRQRPRSASSRGEHGYGSRRNPRLTASMTTGGFFATL